MHSGRLTDRDNEHYEIACSFKGKSFSHSEYVERYSRKFPDREVGSIMPRDYCLPSSPSMTGRPKFLRRIKRNQYELIQPLRWL
jgi:hypothetical protein